MNRNEHGGPFAPRLIWSSKFTKAFTFLIHCKNITVAVRCFSIRRNINFIKLWFYGDGWVVVGDIAIIHSSKLEIQVS